MLPNSVTVLVATEPVDFRKTFDGLCGVVRDALNEDPLSPALFVSRNRRGDQLRILWWESPSRMASLPRPSCHSQSQDTGRRVRRLTGQIRTAGSCGEGRGHRCGTKFGEAGASPS
jgi:hypothetical protein